MKSHKQYLVFLFEHNQLSIQWVPAFFRGGGVKRPGRGVNHVPPSSAEVKQRYTSIYISSSFTDFLQPCCGF